MNRNPLTSFNRRALVFMIQDEAQRIVDTNLATPEQIKKSVYPAITYIDKNFIGQQDVLTDKMAKLHQVFSSIKLPGDFQKYAEDEKLFIVLDLPYDEKMFEVTDDDVEELEDESEGEDTDEEDCDEILIAKSVHNFLKNMAYNLGKNGKHEAAYLIEQTAGLIEKQFNGD